MTDLQLSLLMNCMLPMWEVASKTMEYDTPFMDEVTKDIEYWYHKVKERVLEAGKEEQMPIVPKNSIFTPQMKLIK